MSAKTLMTAVATIFLTLSGCASTGDGNTTYAQYQGSQPIPDFGAADPSGMRVPY
ncbi:hypothetical protein [Rhizobium sp. Root482]|jgi:hypothetical protein|uniref:hypothetical protein n=1 Tax=Rhizobium sp. Root482 TaxID=1736543 RepID=UPI000AFBE801|nr:hypothetical protein [Rhizobium sp. Root482]